MPSGESCCVDCHTSTWPLPPPQVATARAYGMGLTCFIPGEIPGYKGFILIRENKSNAIIRSHLRGGWHQSVEYVHVNLLDFFLPGIPPVCDSQWMAFVIDTGHCFYPFLTALGLLLEGSHWRISRSFSAFISVCGIPYLRHPLISLVTSASPGPAIFPPAPSVPAPDQTSCVELNGIPLLLTHQWSRGLLYIQN